MFKSLGERKQRYKGRNKRNGKKPRYHSRKNKCQAHSPIRNYFKSYLNSRKYNYEIIEEISYPMYYKKTLNWYDATAPKPTVFKFIN